MKFKPILIVSGEPNSIFSEILIKSLTKIKIKNPIIIISSEKLLKSQMKILNLKKKIKKLDYERLSFNKLNNSSINLIDIKYNQSKIIQIIDKLL